MKYSRDARPSSAWWAKTSARRRHRGAGLQRAFGDINVRMISQGASEINITFVIDEAAVPEAIRRLHKHFFAAPDPEVFD